MIHVTIQPAKQSDGSENWDVLITDNDDNQVRIKTLATTENGALGLAERLANSIEFILSINVRVG